MPTIQIALGIEMGMLMTTIFSHVFNTNIISVYQIWGNCRRELWAVAMLPKRKESQGTEGLQARSLLQAPGTEQASHRATLPLPERRQCLLCPKASTEVSQNQTKVLFNQTPQLASLPCPLLGTTWIWKLQYLLPMIKMFTWANNNNKKKMERAFASSTSPFSEDVDIIKCISCSSRDRLSLDFYPYTEATDRNSCLPENGQTTHYSSTLMTELIHSSGDNADAQCRASCPLPQ